MALTLTDWHKRFTHQAGWTSSLRQHFYNIIQVSHHFRVLEVGCGTGAILGDFCSSSTERTSTLRIGENLLFACGLDIRLDYLSIAQKNLKDALLIQGNAYKLPFESDSFDLTLCHYFLLWLNSPESALREMHRITRKGGFVIAFAEPDYGGRIDYPDELKRLGELQRISLLHQGAELEMGRRLAELFSKFDFEEKTTGVLASQWPGFMDQEELQMEWAVILSDIGELTSSDEINDLHEIDKQSWKETRRILYVPTFYACGKVRK